MTQYDKAVTENIKRVKYKTQADVKEAKLRSLTVVKHRFNTEFSAEKSGRKRQGVEMPNTVWGKTVQVILNAAARANFLAAAGCRKTLAQGGSI